MDQFQIQNGIKQDAPLALFLFLSVAKGFGALMKILVDKDFCKSL